MSRLRQAVAHWQLAVGLIPSLLVNRQCRTTLREMRRFLTRCPEIMAMPLPQAMQVLEDIHPQAPPLPEAATRNLADLAALTERRSPLGLCLRRSLVRYVFLRRLKINVQLCFGAKLVRGSAEKTIAGHAWLTRDGKPYHEMSDNWQGFTVMFTHPSPL